MCFSNAMAGRSVKLLSRLNMMLRFGVTIP